MAKADLFMKTDRGVVVTVADHGNHLAVAAGGAFINDPLQQWPGNILPLLIGVQVDRILHRETELWLNLGDGE